MHKWREKRWERDYWKERRREERRDGATGDRVNSGEDIEGGDENADAHGCVDRDEERDRIRRQP